MNKKSVLHLESDDDVIEKIIDALQAGPGRKMDLAFALYVLGWRLEGESAISPTGSCWDNAGKHELGWLEYYSTSMSAIAPAVFETDRFYSVKIQKSTLESTGYYAVVKSMRHCIPQTPMLFQILSGRHAKGMSYDNTAAAALCKASLMCVIDEREKFGKDHAG